MFGLSRLVAMAIIFFMGFGLAAGLFIGIPAAVVASYSLRDLENTNLVNIPDEKYLNPPEGGVDVLDLNGIELYYEIKELQSYGDDLTMNLLRNRYGIIFDEKLDLMLTDEAMNMPLYRLFSMEGVHAVLDNVFIGDIEHFECFNEDGTPGGVPSDPTSYWVNQDGKRITALEEIIADFSLDDFISGRINTDEILHGDITLADILGYRYDEETKCWYDSYDNKVTGIMAVFADCTLDTVDEKINEAKIGELLSYTWADSGEVDEDGNPIFRWETIDEETGVSKPVTGIMKAVADRNINNLGGLYDSLTVGDLVPEEQRTGIFSILSADTKLDGIAGEINDKIKESPLQFYMNENLISFADQESLLDNICNFNGYVITYSDEDPNFSTMDGYYHDYAVEVSEGVYVVEEWRTKPLNDSFSYILGIVTESLTPTP